MLNLESATSGNVKLRGLLESSRSLMHQRQLKKALTNANIANEFATRSGEAPAIALEAQLLTAEIYLLNASYTFDESLLHKGWRILEQLEAGGLKGINFIPVKEILLIKADSKRRLGLLDDAISYYQELLQQLTKEDKLYHRTLIGLIYTHGQRGKGIPAELLTHVTSEPTRKLDQEDFALSSQLALAKAHDALARNDVGVAIDAAHQALKFAELSEFSEPIALAQYFLGLLSRKRANYAISLRFLYEAMDLAERMDFMPILMSAHLEIGKVFAQLANDREAVKYFEYVAEKALEYNQPETLYAASLSLGISAQRTEQVDLANTNLTRAIQAAKELGWNYKRGIALAELASVKLKEGQLGLAAHLAEEATRLFGESQRLGSAKNFLTQAKLEELSPSPDLKRILQLSDQAVQIAHGNNFLEIEVEALQLKASAFEKQEEHVEALHCTKKAAELAMKLVLDQRSQQLPDLDMRAALREQEREIEKLTQENDLKSALVAKNDEIEQANRDLIQANEQLRQFAYVASHDLKEPLRQIGSYVSLIRRNYEDLLDERGKSFFGYVTEGVTRLNRLFDSLMHYSAVGRIETLPTQVDLNKTITSIEKELRSTIRETGASLNYSTLPQVQTTEKLVRHVLLALIENAIKFRRPEEAPHVRIEVQQEDDYHVFAVCDNGIGIEEHYQDKVFILFQMLHAKKEYSGTGVGLAIAQKTVQRLGGRIWYQANTQQPGTTFYFTIPVASEAPVGDEQNASSQIAA